ncbi:PLP-dependent aminotransferase family protein [Rhodoligotrophos defluvii]|uniref:MocR-like ectoine utilization transcription factor EhuR n=1 Tax=Rhodoligotrophos defluvii TaxID=2561934 RepID=UPI0010C94772|nr:PLP-dependent aminotransferase family protein [Rhodoligotrophos defluvii]
MWIPNYKNRKGKLYVAIADALAEDIAEGRLAPGARLPTHRELAWQLKLSVSTVSKAYALAERRHLIEGSVGRGTFVTSRPSDLPRLEPNRAQSDRIDLSFNCLVVLPSQQAAIARAMQDVVEGDRIEALVPYHRPWLGFPEHRLSAVKWLSALGYPAHADDIVIVNGAQQAAAAILNAITEPGDTILLEELADPGIRFLVANRHLTPKSVAIDQHGVIPEAFEAACKGGTIRALFCIPTHHSPTLAVMPVERRKALAEIAARYDVAIIENDVCGGLMDRPLPPIASFAPEHGFYLTSLSKVISAGLRIGFIAAPRGRAKDLIPGLASTTWMASLFSVEIASRLIENGAAQRLVDEQREELRKRQAMAADLLSGYQVSALPTGLHVWVTLPESWRAEGFVAAANSRGVAVTPAEAFMVGHGPAPQAVRLSLGGATPSRGELQQGLEIVAELLRSKRPAASYLVL